MGHAARFMALCGAGTLIQAHMESGPPEAPPPPEPRQRVHLAAQPPGRRRRALYGALELQNQCVFSKGGSRFRPDRGCWCTRRTRPNSKHLPLHASSPRCTHMLARACLCAFSCKQHKSLASSVIVRRFAIFSLALGGCLVPKLTQHTPCTCPERLLCSLKPAFEDGLQPRRTPFSSAASFAIRSTLVGWQSRTTIGGSRGKQGHRAAKPVGTLHCPTGVSSTSHQDGNERDNCDDW